MSLPVLHLTSNLTRGSRVEETQPGVWHLEIPAGPRGRYRLAQLDDYRALARRAFPWRPPLRLRLRARASAPQLPGTWGFGLWNDPFSLSLGLGGAAQRFPALPNTAWFFYASAPNYLSFRNDLPAQGFLAATFRSAGLPAPLLALGAPLLALPLAARLGRWMLRKLVQQEARLVSTDVATWHTYSIQWEQNSLCMQVDGETVCETAVSPCAPLSLVLWIDNQFAALLPKGHLTLGYLANPEPAWLELAEIQVEAIAAG